MSTEEKKQIAVGIDPELYNAVKLFSKLVKMDTDVVFEKIVVTGIRQLKRAMDNMPFTNLKKIKDAWRLGC